jgi:hypothetical protein
MSLADPALPPALAGRRGPDRLWLWLGRRSLWDDSQFHGGLLVLLKCGRRFFRLINRPIRLCNRWGFRLARRLLVGRIFGLRDGRRWRWGLLGLRLDRLFRFGWDWPRAYRAERQILWKIMIEIDCGLFPKTRYRSRMLGASVL